MLDGFALDKTTQVRQDVKTDVEVSLREALANLLIHADYEDNSSIIVEAYKNNYVLQILVSCWLQKKNLLEVASPILEILQ